VADGGARRPMVALGGSGGGWKMGRSCCPVLHNSMACV